MVGEFLREAVDVEAAHAGDVLAQVLAAAQAGAAGAADQRGVRHHAVAGLQRGHAVADRHHLARRLGADAERELPLGEGHAAKAPHVDVVQADEADAKLHLAGRRAAAAASRSTSAISRSASSCRARIVGMPRRL